MAIKFPIPILNPIIG
jgi:hypothetical protein